MVLQLFLHYWLAHLLIQSFQPIFEYRHDTEMRLGAYLTHAAILIIIHFKAGP